MAEDSFTEQSSEGWGSRIMGSLVGILIGIVMFFGAFPLLIWNEGRAIDTARALSEGRSAVVSVKTDTVVPANDGHLVYVSGQMASRDSLAPPSLLPAPALKLKRTVELFQWTEKEESSTKKELGGSSTTTKTYSYQKAWSDAVVNSASFKHPEGHGNPASKPLEDKETQVKAATLGAFQLSDSVLGLLNDYQPVPGQALAALVRQEVRGSMTMQGEWAYSGNSQQPRLGDVRVSYSYVPLGVASIVARQSGAMLGPYTTSNGHELLMAEAGTVNADGLFRAEEKANSILTWILRGGGWLAMLIGITLVLRPLSVLADLIPFLGDLLGMGFFVLAFPISLCLSLVTIAIAWIAFRPLIGIPLLLVGLAMLVVPVLKRRAASGKSMA